MKVLPVESPPPPNTALRFFASPKSGGIGGIVPRPCVVDRQRVETMKGLGAKVAAVERCFKTWNHQKKRKKTFFF